MGRDLKNARFGILPIFFVLLFSLFLRYHTFFLTHFNFDEMTYLSLALKLDDFGFRNFNKTFDLHHIEVREDEDFLAPFLSDKDIGNILTMSEVDYEYRSPTHRPPAFSYALMLSHRIFAKDSSYLAARRNFNPYALRAQFYACIVPVFFSLAFIFATYLLGKLLFSEKIGLYAALFISLSPTELFTSQKIWAESMISFFTVLTVILYFMSVKKDNLIYTCLAGIAAGLAVLTKLNAGFIILVILIFHLANNFLSAIKTKKFYKIIFDARIIVFILSFLGVTVFWLSIYVSNSGIGMPSGPAQILTDWLRLLGSRPWYVYLVSIPCQFPLYFLVVWSLPSLFISKEKRQEKEFLFLWFSISFLFLAFQVWHKEERYILPSLPALAILSAYVLDLSESLLNKIKPYLGYLVTSMFVIASGWWALKISISAIISRADLINIPL